MYNRVGNLCTGDYMDSSIGFVHLDSSFDRLVCCCRDRRILIHLGSPSGTRGRGEGRGCFDIYGQHLFFFCVVGQLCGGLQCAHAH